MEHPQPSLNQAPNDKIAPLVNEENTTQRPGNSVEGQELGIMVSWRHFKYVLPALIAVLYFQGYSYRAGILEGCTLNPSWYPLGQQEVFVQTYFFYMNLLSHTRYVLYLVLAVFMFLLLISICNQIDEKALEASPIPIAVSRVATFVTRHKVAFAVPALLLVLFYSTILVFIISVVPYFIGRNEGQSRLEKLRLARSDTVVTLKWHQREVTFPAVVIESSDKFLSYLSDDNKVETLPFSEISKISHNLSIATVELLPPHLNGHR